VAQGRRGFSGGQEYVTVSIPLTDMLKSSPDFILKYLKWVSISAEGGVYKVRNLRLETAPK
jgi:hypothetical protein